MTREEAIETLKNIKAGFETDEWLQDDTKALDKSIETLENIKTMGEEMRKFREGIKDENVLIGFNMAIAICNKYLGE